MRSDNMDTLARLNRLRLALGILLSLVVLVPSSLLLAPFAPAVQSPWLILGAGLIASAFGLGAVTYNHDTPGHRIGWLVGGSFAFAAIIAVIGRDIGNDVTHNPALGSFMFIVTFGVGLAAGACGFLAKLHHWHAE